MKKLFLAVLVSSMLSGCVPVSNFNSPEEIAKREKMLADFRAENEKEKQAYLASKALYEKLPALTFKKTECSDAWQRTQVAIQQSSWGKIQVATDTVIDTYTVEHHSMSSTKIPTKTGCTIQITATSDGGITEDYVTMTKLHMMIKG